MKRYFEVVDKRQTIEFDIKDCSQAAMAPAEAFGNAYKMNLREISKSEYAKLKKEYTNDSQ